jgi:hypothetical protein
VTLLNGLQPVTLRAVTISLVIGVVGVTLAFAGVVAYLVSSPDAYPISTLAEFGESFGAISALFAGLAFAGVILTITLQRQELSESREIFRIQRFEGSFYRLLSLYRRNLDDIAISDTNTGHLHTGVSALSYICKKLNQVMQKYSSFLELEDQRPLYEIQLFIEIQKLIHRQGRYLGTLRNILELIERDLPNERERIPYWNIIAGQITSNEARYLFYCCLVSADTDPLRELMHRSGLVGSRLQATNLSSTHRALYERVHGIEIPKARTQLVTPYPRNQFRKLKRRARRVARLSELGGE